MFEINLKSTPKMCVAENSLIDWKKSLTKNPTEGKKCKGKGSVIANKTMNTNKFRLTIF